MRKLLCLALILLCCFSSALAERLAARDLLAARLPEETPAQVPGRGRMRYYAQNDPAWAQMTYRFPHQGDLEPRFSGAGCVPSALANCIANLVPKESLRKIDAASYRGEGFWICPCSMNRFDCDQTHTRWRLASDEDFARYFCLVVGSYCSGNNQESDYACGTLYLAGALLDLYGLPYELTDDFSRAAAAVTGNGALAVMLVGGPDCPFTTGGHALVLCAADEQSYYFLDSFRRDEYPLDCNRILRVVEPGVVAVRRDKVDRLGAYSIYVAYPGGDQPSFSLRGNADANDRQQGE